MYYYTRLVPFLSMPDLPDNKAFFCIFFCVPDGFYSNLFWPLMREREREELRRSL